MQVESDFHHQNCSGLTTELVFFYAYTDPPAKLDECMRRRMSEGQGRWQPSAAMGNGSGWEGPAQLAKESAGNS